MNASLLLQHFERLAEASGAVGSLRQFILDLAACGALVPQDSHEEIAEQLLEQIYAGADGAVGDRRRVRNGSAVDIPIDALPFTIPDSWAWAYLTDICEVSYGFAFESSGFRAPGVGMPLIRIRDISSADTEAYFEGSFDASYVVHPGDLLVGMDGDFNVREWNGPEALLNQRVMRLLRWKGGMSSRWVAIPLQIILNHLHASTSQTTVKHLSAKQVKGIQIPIPPLPEQHRIIVQVEELMALCDQLEASQVEREQRREDLTRRCFLGATRVRASEDPEDGEMFWVEHLPRMITLSRHVDALRRTILAYAVRGRLVPQEAHDQPASVLVADIEGGRTRARRSGRSARPIEVGPFPPLPTGWTYTTIGDMFDVYVGATPSRDYPSLWNGDIPWVSSGEVAFNRIHTTRESITAAAVGDSITRVHPPGTVMLGMIGQGKTRGQPAILDIAAAHNQNCASIRVSATPIPPDYVFWVLAERYEMTRVLAEGGSQPALNGEKVRSIPLALPPLAEQHRIVRKIEELMSLCDSIATALRSAEDQRAKLLESLLQEVLKHGKIVGGRFQGESVDV